MFSATPDIIEKQHEETVLGAFTRGFKDSDITVRDTFGAIARQPQLI